MSEVNVFCDFHHHSLLRSFVLLFENRFNWNLYRPIGMEWFYEGYWGYNNIEATAKQFLDTKTTIIADKTPALNIVSSIDDYIYNVYDPGHVTTHKAISLNTFKEIKFDYIIASVPQNVNIFKDLIKKYQPSAKLIIQFGNNWVEPEDGSNVMASVKGQGWGRANVVYYHQEFDTNLFKPIDEFGFRKISTYINVLQENKGWVDFLNIENYLLDKKIVLKSYGGQCRDGSFNGAEAVSKSVQKNDFVFQVKYTGDGYGHALYNAYACGKPTIIRSSYYKDQLGEELFNDDNCIDLDKMDFDDAMNKIIDVINDIDQLKTMSTNAYRAFTNAVNFEQDAEKVQKWLANL